MSAAAPTLDVERSLATGGLRYVAGCDEVGRGALAGPVSVGIVVVDPWTSPVLEGVRDSKRLRPAAREELVPAIRAWAAAYGVGHASAAEIDELGLVPALGLAGRRALSAARVRPDVVLLDGNLDWLAGGGQGDLFDDGARAGDVPPVALRVKADLQCLSVAAASVLAKVERDGLMDGYDAGEPAFGWARNKGYGTAAHRAAILAGGPSRYHRRSWRLGLPDQAQ
ncbi:ribonuclease HII [Zafaria sp. J156]|uniref:ribonuclease HII n=1 Tax=Zafaria sp. J156 TaxID=3116490 RepID=UPI002E7A3947|nr:ribonuclease HII [Zafaria sp. J156]MEE1620686.1 ribonuclease HII [Zafaria sp. J156]